MTQTCIVHRYNVCLKCQKISEWSYDNGSLNGNLRELGTLGGLEAQCELTLIGRANGDAFEVELLNYNLTSACRPQLCLNTHTHLRTHTE